MSRRYPHSIPRYPQGVPKVSPRWPHDFPEGSDSLSCPTRFFQAIEAKVSVTEWVSESVSLRIHWSYITDDKPNKCNISILILVIAQIIWVVRFYSYFFITVKHFLIYKWNIWLFLNNVFCHISFFIPIQANVICVVRFSSYFHRRPHRAELHRCSEERAELKGNVTDSTRLNC